MAGVVDADTHIIEHPGMWELFDPELYPRRPVLASTTDNSVYGHNNQVWLIDGVAVPKRFGKGSAIVAVGGSDAEEARTDIAKAVRYITDATARVRDMDMRGVDAEVVFPTLLLGYLPVEVDLEVAICTAYNRYLAKAWEQGGDRLRWVVVPPLRDMQASVREIETARDHGAVGVFFRGIEGERTLDNPYFHPIYQAANDTELPILIHTGAGCPLFIKLFDVERNHTFGHSRIQPILAFRDLIANKIPAQYPKLKFGFIEASAGWVPFMMHILKRLFKEKWQFASDKDMFREYRIFVAAEADEDIKYISEFTGEDHLIIGSDYGHQDPSEERQLVAAIRARDDVPQSIANKMFFDNPKLLYPLN